MQFSRQAAEKPHPTRGPHARRFPKLGTERVGRTLGEFQPANIGNSCMSARDTAARIEDGNQVDRDAACRLNERFAHFPNFAILSIAGLYLARLDDRFCIDCSRSRRPRVAAPFGSP
jgi:hypothetical protein